MPSNDGYTGLFGSVTRFVRMPSTREPAAVPSMSDTKLMLRKWRRFSSWMPPISCFGRHPARAPSMSWVVRA